MFVRSDVIPKMSPRRSAILVAMVAAITVAFVSPADATAGDFVCTATGQMNIDPPLTATNRMAKVTQPAVATTAHRPTATTPACCPAAERRRGRRRAPAVSIPAACSCPWDARGVFTWAPTGQHRVVEFPVNLNSAAGVFTVTGYVTGGLLSGDTITFVGARAESRLRPERPEVAVIEIWNASSLQVQGRPSLLWPGRAQHGSDGGMPNCRSAMFARLPFMGP